jgi:uncharacterized protein YdhG (YjbR/CyaY superfamily)
MQSKAATVAAYLAELPPEERAVIVALDQLVRSAVPSAVGSMKYGMPSYESAGHMIALNAQKNYFSFYADPEIVREFRGELKGRNVGKSCIRFRKTDSALLVTLRKIAAATLR